MGEVSDIQLLLTNRQFGLNVYKALGSIFDVASLEVGKTPIKLDSSVSLSSDGTLVLFGYSVRQSEGKTHIEESTLYLSKELWESSQPNIQKVLDTSKEFSLTYGYAAFGFISAKRNYITVCNGVYADGKG